MTADMTAVSEEHDRALERLRAALAEQDRLTDRYEAAMGTSAELSANVRLQAASEEVRARDAWLKWTEDEDYRGLEAEPSELERELEHALGPVC
jgi:hypothetical protein